MTIHHNMYAEKDKRPDDEKLTVPTVMVSGGFDPVHAGHIRMIGDAANFGDVIVVANSTWSAMQSASKIIIKTEDGNLDLNNESIKIRLQEDSKLEGIQAGNTVGNVEEGFASSSRIAAE